MIVDRLIYEACRSLLGDSAQVERLLAGAYARSLNSAAARPAVAGALRRILVHASGREPRDCELDQAISEMAAVQASIAAFIFSHAAEKLDYARLMDADFLAPLSELRKAGRGVIMATPHFGNHPLIVVATAQAGIPVSAMYVFGSPFQAEAAALLSNIRLLDLGCGAVDTMSALRRGEAVLLFSDIDFFPGGRTMDFFGAPFRPPHGPARLSLASGAPVLPVYCLLESGRFRLAADKPLLPRGDQEELERGLLRSMESFIGRKPGHWIISSDPWDLEGNARRLRRMFQRVRFSRGLRRIWKELKGLFRGP